MVSIIYWYVTYQLQKHEPRWYRAAELKEDFPDIFDPETGNIDNLIFHTRSQLYVAKGNVKIDQDDEDEESRSLLYDGWPRAYVAEDVIDQEERWCVLTPVNIGKWKICNIWFLTLSGLALSFPISLYLYAVCIRFFML
jgi:hypothetical protein